MALAYNNYGYQTTGISVDMMITIPAGTTLIVVALISSSTTARTGGAPTWNGSPLTQLGTNQAGSAECNAELWYLINPDVGYYSLVIPNTGGLTLDASISCFSGRPAVFGTPQQTGTSSANPSLTINSVPAGGLCVAVLGHGYKDAPTGR